MPGYPDVTLPTRPFFSCEQDEFLIVDRSDMKTLLTTTPLEPWLRLVVGASNVVESPPLKVVHHSQLKVLLQCRDALVELDFHDELARKTLPDGSQLLYMGGLSEANEGRGWIPSS